VGAPSFAWFAKGGYHYRRQDGLIVLSCPYPTFRLRSGQALCRKRRDKDGAPFSCRFREKQIPPIGRNDKSEKFLALVIALLVFATAAVFLFAELAFGRRLRVVYAMLHRFCCAKKGEDRLEVVIG